MASDQTSQDPQEAARTRRMLKDYARSTGGEHDGEPLYSIACDLIAEILTLAALDGGVLPEVYGQSRTERVATLAARSMWNALDLSARQAAQAASEEEPDGPMREDVAAALAAVSQYLLGP